MTLTTRDLDYWPVEYVHRLNLYLRRQVYNDHEYDDDVAGRRLAVCAYYGDWPKGYGISHLCSPGERKKAQRFWDETQWYADIFVHKFQRQIEALMGEHG